MLITSITLAPSSKRVFECQLLEGEDVATIELLPDNIQSSTLWKMTWVEQNCIIGSIVYAGDGTYQIVLEAMYCNPMKSFAGSLFTSRDAAVDEVCRYLGGR